MLSWYIYNMTNKTGLVSPVNDQFTIWTEMLLTTKPIRYGYKAELLTGYIGGRIEAKLLYLLTVACQLQYMPVAGEEKRLILKPKPHSFNINISYMNISS